ncbi:hypothetical protein QZH41_014308, partial [Actinostola sp. cb2023]
LQHRDDVLAVRHCTLGHYKDFLHRLLCRCVEKAREKGYQYVGLQFFGQCWSGPASQNFAQAGQSSNCIQQYFRQCQRNNKGHACIGGQWTNYVYRVKQSSRGNGRGHEHGRGNGRGHEHGRGNGRGHEHGRGNGRGHQHGRGNGRGHEHSRGNGDLK